MRTVSRKQLRIERLFAEPGEDVLDSVSWDRRTASVGPSENPVFVQGEVEFPTTWSVAASNVVAHNYFRGKRGSKNRETSLKQLVRRITETISFWGQEQGYFADDRERDAFTAELIYLLLHQRAAFNSPVWFNLGYEPNPVCSACFILGVEDAAESLLGWEQTEGRIFAAGGGAGVNLSSVRGARSPLPDGGESAGVLPYMSATDAWAGAIKSGGLRRAAKMMVVDAEHPDIIEFIGAKVREEERAQALAAAGFDVSIGGSDAAAISLQNSNLAVRLSDAFMRAVELDEHWAAAGVSARELFDKLTQASWRAGDPGVQFADTINAWHTTPLDGEIRASNPCGEFLHVDNSACNLASINVLPYLDEGEFDVAGFEHTVRVLLTAQDILVDRASYPTKEIGENSHRFRQLGLGLSNLGGLLMSLGLPYDSNSARDAASALTACLSATAYRRSAELAAALGPYPGFIDNAGAHLGVLAAHREAVSTLGKGAISETLARSARSNWATALELAERCGVRNAQVSALAPAGTISLVMDCETTGVEPHFALAKTKTLVNGGSITSVNGNTEAALEQLGYDEQQRTRIVEHLATTRSLIGAPGLDPDDLAVFDCALGERCIPWRGHVDMLAALQPHISGGISKTINLPSSATPAEIREIYLSAWRKGVKALTVYRDGSKHSQVMQAEASSGQPPACSIENCS